MVTFPSHLRYKKDMDSVYFQIGNRLELNYKKQKLA